MFKFSLTSVLSLQLQLEDQAKNRLMVAVAKFDIEAQILEVLQCDLSAVQEQQRQPSSDAAELQYTFVFSRFLIAKIKQQEEVVKQLAVKVTMLRDELVRFRSEVKKLERLKTRRLYEFNCTEQRRSQAIIDEAALIQFNRKQAGGASI